MSNRIGVFDEEGNLVRPRTRTQPESSSDSPASQVGSDRKENSDLDEDIVHDVQLADLIEKGFVEQPSAMDDVSQKNENAAFNNAVNLAFSFFGQANAVRNRSVSGSTSTEFKLTEEELRLLRKKAREFSEFGFVPVDVLEDFLFVLCTIREYQDLEYIALTVGIDDLLNPDIIRIPMRILNKPNLYKIGFIANGLSILTKEFATNLQRSAEATDQGSSNFGGFNTKNLPSFGGIQGIQGLGSTISNIQGTLSQQVQDFGSGSTSDLFSQIQNIPSVLPNLLENIEQLSEQFKNLSSLNIGALKQTSKKISDLVQRAKYIEKLTEQLGDISELASEEQLVGDVREQLSKVNSKTQDLQNRYNEVLSEIANTSPPENINELLGQVGIEKESDIMFHYLKTVLGQAPPIQMLSNNPTLKKPTEIGKRLFGQLPSTIPAIDQSFARRIAVFSDPTNSAGTQSFEMQNFGSFGGSQTLTSSIQSILGSSNSQVENVINNVGNILGSATNANIELRRSDNAIPLMIGLTSALAGEVNSPFPTSTFNNGWKLATSVGNYVQDRNPEFLKACRERL